MTDAPLSAARLAEQLGDRLLRADDVSDEAVELVERVRDLVEAVVVTALPVDERRALGNDIAAITARLQAVRRDDVVLLVRHDDGHVESLSQAGSGKLNPQAPRLEFEPVPPMPPADSGPVPVEVRARCTLTAAHSGPPGSAHGGIVALLLDQVIGIAAAVAGATGLTVGLNVSFRAVTPIDVPLEISARWARQEGRKSFASGEIRADGVVTAEATGVFVRERGDGE